MVESPEASNTLEDISIQADKVVKFIRMIDTKEAHGSDKISVAMFKICDRFILDPLCMILQKSLRNEICPSSWKKANIIPVYKKDTCQSKKLQVDLLINNIGKIFEKLLCDDIFEHLITKYHKSPLGLYPGSLFWLGSDPKQGDKSCIF